VLVCPLKKGLRTCVAASALGEALELERADRQALYFAALLRSLGCTAHASTFAEVFDDDVAIQRELKTLDLEDPATVPAQTARFAVWAGTKRAQELSARIATEVPENGVALGRGACEVSAALGARLELPGRAIAALDEVYERYDGKGFPAGRAGDALTVSARVVHVAEQAVMAHFDGGHQAAAHAVARRAGRHLDPDICATFSANIEPITGPLDSPDLLATAIAAEPPPVITVSTPGRLNDSADRLRIETTGTDFVVQDPRRL
jgi:hypothetical protein